MRTGLLAAFGLLFGVLAAVAVPAVSVAASGQVCMGVVVDDGSGGAPTPQTAQVSAGTSDLQALSAAGDTATQNNSGLVCEVNGFPADGLQNCTRVAGGGQYYYWAYWHGDPASNSWTYGQAGPASHAVATGQTYVEGWSYQNPGADNANAMQPKITPAAAFAAACPGVAPVPASGGGSSGGSGSGGSSSGAGSAPAASPPSPGAAVPTTAPPSGGAATSPSSTGSNQAHGTPAAGAGATTTTPSSAALGASSSGGSSTTTTSSGEQRGKGRSGAAALASSTPHGGSDGAPILSIVLVAIVIAAIGGLSLYRWRRRPAEE